MLHATKGIVFHSVKYSETSVVARIYTEVLGMQSFLIRGIHSPKSKMRPALFQPMTLLDLVVYHHEKQVMQSVREVHLAHPYQTIPFDIRKSSVMIFINELVYKVIREEEPNADLFHYLWNNCLLLDETEANVSSFHLHVALQLMHHLGIFPNNNYSRGHQVFNMREGLFQHAIPGHQHYLDPVNSLLFHNLLSHFNADLKAGNVTGDSFHLTPAVRDQLLETLLVYYRLHLPGFGGMQSHHILHDVLG